MIIDLICFILLVVGAILFTVLFVLTKNNFRYVFILFIAYSLFIFVTSSRDIEVYFENNKSKEKASLTSLKKASIV